MHAKSLQSCGLFVTPWTVACQAPPAMGFSKQEHWTGLPCPPPGGLPDPASTQVSYVSCIGRRILYLSATGKPKVNLTLFHPWSQLRIEFSRV